MDIISNKNVYDIIKKTLGVVNSDIAEHGEVVAYILYKMLQYENKYTRKELIDYVLIGFLHDLGLYRTENLQDLAEFESKSIWAHSIYGYLFLKYLSPIGDEAEIVLYHHLEYRLHDKINSKYLKIAQYLFVADKIDSYLRMKHGELEKDYFITHRDISFSGHALDLFYKTESAFHITAKLADGSYKEEIGQLMQEASFSEKYKHEFFKTLVYLIDFRSECTVIHTMSTVCIAMEISRLMKLDAYNKKCVYYGALFHDLGKLGIPVSILEAPRLLSEEEMRVMRAHVRITEMILEDVVQDDVLQIAVRHHEKLDGSGYHKGLKGDVLTKPQRIVAAADLLSALSQKRSYKGEFDSEVIRGILQEEADNNKICPEVVGVIQRNYARIMNSYKANSDQMIGMYLEIKKQYDIIYERFKMYGKE